jgi:hypothetical protein
MLVILLFQAFVAQGQALNINFRMCEAVAGDKTLIFDGSASHPERIL